MSDSFQLRLLRLQADLRARLADVHDVRKALIYGLRATRELFGAHEAAAATLRPGRAAADLIFSIPRGVEWDIELLDHYLAGARPRVPEDVLLAPVRRRDRNWSVLALRCCDRPFGPEYVQALFSITQILTNIVRAVDARRARQVRRRIERKIADRQEPKDVIYDILHGLRSLTRYDHSASLFVSRDGSGTLELVAEQIAWTKAKSQRVGMHLDLPAGELEHGGVRLYERGADGWRTPDSTTVAILPALLEHGSSPAPPQVAMLCAPIAAPGGPLGVLTISARRPGVLGAWEARAVEELIALTSLAVQFSVRQESLQEKVLESERKHALANLTRGIAHDVNNALGAMLPLVQQMREDAAHGRLEPATMRGDLESLEKSLETCRRIFGGMLSIARGSRHDGVGHGNLRRAIDGALSVLEDGLRRQSVDVALDVPAELPTIRGSQGDLTQLFLNLFTNARDAMPGGGRLEIAVTPRNGDLQVTVADSGCGIPREFLGRVLEPFFTTKPEGNGLGLSICRSILWDLDGEVTIESEEGEGTSLILSLPVLDQEDAG